MLVLLPPNIKCKIIKKTKILIGNTKKLMCFRPAAGGHGPDMANNNQVTQNNQLALFTTHPSL